MTGFPGFLLYVKLGSCPRREKVVSCHTDYGIKKFPGIYKISRNSRFGKYVVHEIQEQQIIFGISPKMILMDYADIGQASIYYLSRKDPGGSDPGFLSIRILR